MVSGAGIMGQRTSEPLVGVTHGRRVRLEAPAPRREPRDRAIRPAVFAGARTFVPVAPTCSAARFAPLSFAPRSGRVCGLVEILASSGLVELFLAAAVRGGARGGLRVPALDR